MDLLKNRKYNEFKEYITKEKDNPLFDINIRDENDNYFITYAILFNNYELVEFLINNNARIDVVDKFSKSILILAIIYNYIDIIELLLKTNMTSIGLSILDLLDLQLKNPLMYAIEFQNINIIKLLLEYSGNPNNTDINNNNSLYYAIKTKNEEIIELLLKKGITNFNHILHLACSLNLIQSVLLLLKYNININIQDDTNDYTALHLTIKLNYNKISKILIEHNININLQDIHGNTALHLAISENNDEILELLLKQTNLNYNLWNINYEIPFHVILINNKDINYNKFIENSNLSIKDKLGNSCLYYLIKTTKWIEYIDILKKKKLNIFALNKNNESILDVCTDSNLLISIIIDSYLYRLKLHKNEWNIAWENDCSIDKIDETKCKELIKNKLTENNNSYPTLKNKIIIDLEQTQTQCTCTFIGNQLDIVVGLINLTKKYKSCSLIQTTDKIFNMELLWINNNLKIPKNFENLIKLCETYRFTIIVQPLKCLSIGVNGNFCQVWNIILEYN